MKQMKLLEDLNMLLMSKKEKNKEKLQEELSKKKRDWKVQEE
jgi:hypothetical protein